MNQQPKIDITQTIPIVCDECGKDQFTVKYYLKRLSALVSPTGEEMIIPMQAFACSSCGHVNEEFLHE